MLVERCFILRLLGRPDGFVLAFLERSAFEKPHPFLEDLDVTGDLDVLSHRVRKPQEVIGAPRPHSNAALGVPPVLHVALPELSACRLQQMLPRHIGCSMKQCAGVLELIPKTESSPRLVET